MFGFVLDIGFCIGVWLLLFWVLLYLVGLFNGCCRLVGEWLYWFGFKWLVLNFGWDLVICDLVCLFVFWVVGLWFWFGF